MGVLGNSPQKTDAGAHNSPHPIDIPRRNLPPRRRRMAHKAVNTIGLGASYRAMLEDIPSDLTVEVEGISFYLHKFPLITQSAWMRRQVRRREEDGGGGGAGAAAVVVVVDEMPGGAEAFTAVARYCYGQSVELREENVAEIRCAAEFMEMGGGQSAGQRGGLIARCDGFVEEVVEKGSLRNLVRVLSGCSRTTRGGYRSGGTRGGGRKLMATADGLGLTTRLVEGIAELAMAQLDEPPRPLQLHQAAPHALLQDSHLTSWWAEAEAELCYLDVQMFRRVVAALRARGLRYDTLSAVIVRYAQRSLEEMMMVEEKSWRKSNVEEEEEDDGRRFMSGSAGIENLQATSTRCGQDHGSGDDDECEEEEEAAAPDEFEAGGGWRPPTPAVAQAAEAAAAEDVERRRRIFLESIVALLPPERNSAPLPFLFSLLRASIFLDTTLSCRFDLEKRIALLLPSAAISDLLIPSFLTFPGDTVFDVDTIRRIVLNFLHAHATGSGGGAAADALRRRLDHDLHPIPAANPRIRHGFASSPFYDTDQDQLDLDCDHQNSSSTGLLRVASLVDGFLAEIAADANLRPAKFVAVAEILPQNARVAHDGLYRAIDIYLKVHPDLGDDERKQVCSVLDCRKLSQEACTHAAQNDRLPLHLLLQILHSEQIKLRSAMSGSPPHDPATCRAGSGGRRRVSGRFHDEDEADEDLVAVLRENQMLRMEMVKMQEQLQLGQRNIHPNQYSATRSGTGRQAAPPASAATRSSSGSNSGGRSSNAIAGRGSAAAKPPLPGKFLLTVSRTLGRLNPFQRSKDGSSGNGATKLQESRRRRHSIS